MMDKYKIVYSQGAKINLKEIYSYIKNKLKSQQNAKSVYARIRKEINSLCIMPERYSIVEWEPWHSDKVHQLSIGKYVAYYVVDKDRKTVNVLRIYYGGRDVEELINNP